MEKAVTFNKKAVTQFIQNNAIIIRKLLLLGYKKEQKNSNLLIKVLLDIIM
jgi:hypothetical protein